jgi:L-alanine-DL-glutamate epimerase-like enolase superfamily enzyme
VKVQIHRITAALREPFESSRGRASHRELLLLVLEDGEGRIGLGEAAPLESYDGVSPDDAHAALEDCRAVLETADGLDRDGLLADCERLAVLPQAVAAVDLALWDLAGRRAGQPVWQLLGAPAATSVEVNHTLSATDRAGAAAEAAGAVGAGYRCLKAKVAIGDDAGRLAAIRAAAGSAVGLRVDANGAWTVAEAQAGLRALTPVGLELCEEPVRGPAAVARLAHLTDVPLALDETASIPGALEERLCAAAGLKLSRWGGITGVIAAGRQARDVGYELYLTSTLDGPVGIAAALHVATALQPDRACGLATLGLFADRPDVLPVLEGRMAVPAGAGLGDGLRSWYGV